MTLLGFFFFLRRSEVMRMRRKDVSFAQLTTENGTRTRILQIYVNEKSKNDSERKGHTRLAAERTEKEICVFRSMVDYLQACGVESTRKIGEAADDPLFPRLEGGAMATDTPGGRLHHWMEVAGIEEPSKYGFHSLRAGAATDAHRNGVTEGVIKAHGNWKSDAVKVYIRQSTAERLSATAALGRGAAEL
jgi:integrase